MFFSINVCFLLEMMELRTRNSCGDGLKTATERKENESRSSCRSSYSVKSYDLLMKITWIDREMFSLFRNSKINSNGRMEAEILDPGR